MMGPGRVGYPWDMIIDLFTKLKHSFSVTFIIIILLKYVLTHLWSIVSTVAYWRFLYRIFQEFSSPKYTVAAPTWQTKEHDKIANSTQAFPWKHTNSSANTREVNRAIALRQKWRAQYHVIKHGFPAIFHILGRTDRTRFRVMGDRFFILTAFISLKLTELMTFIF